MKKNNTRNIISDLITPLKNREIKSLKFKTILSFIFLSCFLLSCSAKLLPPPEWTYEKEAVTIHIEADHNLNLYERESHPLHLCVYQLKNPNGFNQLSSNLSGLYELLDCLMFDASVAVVKQITVYPGETMDITLDRAEEAKYLAVAAGYFELSKENITRLIDIPVKIKTSGFIRKTKKQVPAPLNFNLYLGQMQITAVE
ncbi:MAG: type VI secretion system lipoprotein TssJ [Desulfobacteraceae bacterium]